VKRSLKMEINNRSCILRTVILTILLIQVSAGYPQDKSQKPSRQSALEAFSNDKFEIAYNQFSELSASFPKDPLYKYYCGICLVKLNRYPGKAASLLQDAIQGSAAIRSVPLDGLFYLGRAQQMNGSYSEAIRSFNQYSEQAGKKASKEAGVAQLVQQCNEKKGQIATIEVMKQVSISKDTINDHTPGTEQKVEKIIQQPVENSTRKKELLPDNYDTLLSQALDYQVKADSLTGLAAQFRKRMETADSGERTDLKIQAQNIDQQVSLNQKVADQKLAEAQKLAIKPGVIKSDTIIGNNKMEKNLQKANSNGTGIVESRPGIIKDSLIGIKENRPEKIVAQQTDKQIQKTSEIFSMFEVVAKPVYTQNEKVEVNPEVPPGLIYRIQLAVFRNPVVTSYFKGITPVFGFKNSGTEMTNYYAGMFRKSEDAVKALTKVKAQGFKDAFVVALLNKNIISADRAGIIEKEWGKKPLMIIDQKPADIPRDTVPPTLVFRVEVIKSVKPVAADQVENIKKLAGSRGLDIIMNESKQNIYLIGKFLSFESASEYCDLLVRNGLREAKVVAYLGKREIPVETARQLFEKY
jgi:hypothetical protein